MLTRLRKTMPSDDSQGAYQVHTYMLPIIEVVQSLRCHVGYVHIPSIRHQDVGLKGVCSMSVSVEIASQYYFVDANDFEEMKTEHCSCYYVCSKDNSA